MKQGAARHALIHRRDDLYETPAAATQALLRHERLPRGLVWEPCAGRGAIVRELLASGYPVTASELVPYDGADDGIATPIDFLMERQAPSGCGCIVTNPPFKLADACIRHGLSLVPRVIVLLRLMAIEGAGRSDLIDRHLVRIWAGIERLSGMHREGWTGPRNDNSAAPFAWFVFDAQSHLPGIAIELRRISWRQALPPITQPDYSQPKGTTP